MRQHVTDYAAAVRDALGRVDADGLEAVTEILFRAFTQRRRVFTLGNGASAALASHIACDLGKGTAVDLGHGASPSRALRLRVTSLVDNVPLLTAYGNDIRYDDIFVEQLKNELEADDVVIGVSGSGGSPNVLRAMAFARARGATTIGLTGCQPAARKLRELCDVCIQAQLTMMEQIEDAHVVFHHIIALALRERIAAHHRAAHAPLELTLDESLLVANDD
jgi:D-sedoheptulose 7-phosphate isomerase